MAVTERVSVAVAVRVEKSVKKLVTMDVSVFVKELTTVTGSKVETMVEVARSVVTETAVWPGRVNVETEVRVVTSVWVTAGSVYVIEAVSVAVKVCKTVWVEAGRSEKTVSVTGGRVVTAPLRVTVEAGRVVMLPLRVRVEAGSVER